MEDFYEGEFHEIIDDIIERDKVKRLVFCSGKFYYELVAEREKLQRDDVAFVRIEQLFPLHTETIQNIINKYKNVEDYIWTQEEPKNMGAWSFMLQRFHLENPLGEIINLKVISRTYYSVPAAGSSARFKERQQKVIDEVFDNKE
jgi:2-oxoglutarate dehydrogenase E1 component